MKTSKKCLRESASENLMIKSPSAYIWGGGGGGLLSEQLFLSEILGAYFGGIFLELHGLRNLVGSTHITMTRRFFADWHSAYLAFSCCIVSIKTP